jgi:hypothetical protein
MTPLRKATDKAAKFRRELALAEEDMTRRRKAGFLKESDVALVDLIRRDWRLAERELSRARESEEKRKAPAKKPAKVHR